MSTPPKVRRASDRRGFALTLFFLSLGLFIWGFVLGADGITLTETVSPGVILIIGALAFASGSYLLGHESR